MNIKQHPDRMLSDIEQRWCNDCGQYWSLKNFYLDSEGRDYGYCKECQLKRNKETKERWRAHKAMNAAKTKTPPEIKKRNPKPKPTAVRTAEAVPMMASTTESIPAGDTCNKCKSYSKHDARCGWCMRKKRQVRGKGWCPEYRADVRVRYAQVAAPVTVNRSSPWD